MSSSRQPTLSDFGNATLEVKPQPRSIDLETTTSVVTPRPRWVCFATTTAAVTRRRPDQPNRESRMAENWEPTYRQCLGCGSAVTDPVAWRQGDENQNVIACPECQPGRGGKDLGTVSEAQDRYMDTLKSRGRTV